jgi:hypothetical protein
LNEEEKVIWKVRDWKRLGSERVERRLTNRDRRLVKLPREAGIVPLREFEGRDLLNEERKISWRVRDWKRLGSEREERRLTNRCRRLVKYPREAGIVPMREFEDRSLLNEEGKDSWRVRDWKRLGSEREERRLTNRFSRLVKFPREAGIVPMREFEDRYLLNEEGKIIWRVRDWKRLSSERVERRLTNRFSRLVKFPREAGIDPMREFEDKSLLNEEGKIFGRSEIGRDWVLRE